MSAVDHPERSFSPSGESGAAQGEAEIRTTPLWHDYAARAVARVAEPFRLRRSARARIIACAYALVLSNESFRDMHIVGAAGRGGGAIAG